MAETVVDLFIEGGRKALISLVMAGPSLEAIFRQDHAQKGQVTIIDLLRAVKDDFCSRVPGCATPRACALSPDDSGREDKDRKEGRKGRAAQGRDRGVAAELPPRARAD